MVPVYIGGCFSMLHPANGGRGVVICGSLSDEALNAYRAFVFLGEQLAGAGFPTLRVSWYGTGDSAGNDEEPDRFEHWLRDIHAAADWLCTELGVTRVTLIGHRIGASLAARAACDIEAVDSLVLIAPIGGRQLLHELTLSARIAQRIWATTHPVDDGIWFESHGLRLAHRTRDALNLLDIRKLPHRPAEQALLIDAGNAAATRSAAEALQRAGTRTTQESFTSAESLLRDSHLATAPHDLFERIGQWIAALPAASAVARAHEPAAASLRLGPLRESPMQFGNGLFGILTQPHDARDGAPALLLLNTSANPRWGNARVATEIARQLAADGIVSLRMDAAGMGDTAPATGETGWPYAEATTADVLQAVDALRRRTQRPVVVLGVCSGAYHALQAAVREERVCGLIAVNLQRFVWREGDPPDSMRRSALRPNSYYLRNLFSAQSWSRLLRADFDVVNVLRVFATRLLKRALARIDPLISLLLPGGTRVGRVRRAMQLLTRRNVRVLYVLGPNDPGVEELAAYFGRDGCRLRGQPNVSFTVLQGADHTLAAHAVRACLIDTIRAWFQANWPRRWEPPPAPEPRPELAEVPQG